MLEKFHNLEAETHGSYSAGICFININLISGVLPWFPVDCLPCDLCQVPAV